VQEISLCPPFNEAKGVNCRYAGLGNFAVLIADEGNGLPDLRRKKTPTSPAVSVFYELSNSRF